MKTVFPSHFRNQVYAMFYCYFYCKRSDSMHSIFNFCKQKTNRSSMVEGLWVQNLRIFRLLVNYWFWWCIVIIANYFPFKYFSWTFKNNAISSKLWTIQQQRWVYVFSCISAIKAGLVAKTKIIFLPPLRICQFSSKEPLSWLALLF